MKKKIFMLAILMMTFNSNFYFTSTGTLLSRHLPHVTILLNLKFKIQFLNGTCHILSAHGVTGHYTEQ